MWNREKETLSRDEYARVQLAGLKKSLARVWANEFYRERLKRGGKGQPRKGDRGGAAQRKRQRRAPVDGEAAHISIPRKTLLREC